MLKQLFLSAIRMPNPLTEGQLAQFERAPNIKAHPAKIFPTLDKNFAETFGLIAFISSAIGNKAGSSIRRGAHASQGHRRQPASGARSCLLT